MDPTTVGVDQARLNRYRSLLKQLGVESLRRRSDNSVEFTTCTYGLAVSGAAKGYLYSEVPPTRLVENTEAADTEPIGEVYRHVEGSWHLYYEWDTERASASA